jgi:hypothetical protein
MAAIPIWKDKIVDLGSASVQFRITADGVVIYSGKATARPGESTAKVRINDICADYLVNSLPSFIDRTFSPANLPSFVVQKKPSSSWTTVTTVQFYPDWSYEYQFSGDVLSFPINGRIDSRMAIFTSKKNITSNVSASYRSKTGSVTTRTCSVSGTPNDGTCTFLAYAVADTERIIVNGNTYNVVTDCARYALYYVNAFGGWDQFLIEGNDMETDSLQRFILEHEYDNGSQLNAGKVNYVSEVTKSWTLNTGWMTDEAGQRMHHLLNSCMVYLVDISTQDTFPVIITTNTCEYKTFKNQGRRAVNYSFTIELAQNRIRR